MAKKKAKKRAVRIAPDSKEYPQYFVTFDGEFVVDGTTIKKPFRVRGTHSFQLDALRPQVDVKVVLSHKPASPGVPNLQITIKRPKQPA